VYLTRDPSDPKYERIREKLIKDLEAISGPTGAPVADVVYRGEAIYEGPYLSEAPDLVIDQAAGVHIPGGLGKPDVFATPSADGWQAENKRHGLFAAAGPAFDTGSIDDLSILDLAPTILHLHDCAVPADMDGEVRRDVFAAETSPSTRDVTYRRTNSRSKEIRRIRRVARSVDL